MTKSCEITWVAGIIEGEGNVRFHDGSPRVVVNMTDLDIITRLAKAVYGRILGPYIHKTNEKALPLYRTAVYGKQAVGLLMTIYQFMGTRRKAKIREVLGAWKMVKPRGLPPKCHPERKHQAHGLCNQCYMKEYNRCQKLMRK